MFEKLFRKRKKKKTCILGPVGLTAGKVVKGGQNEVVPGLPRPPAPGGSGGKVSDIEQRLRAIEERLWATLIPGDVINYFHKDGKEVEGYETVTVITPEEFIKATGKPLRERHIPYRSDNLHDPRVCSFSPDHYGWEYA